MRTTVRPHVSSLGTFARPKMLVGGSVGLAFSIAAGGCGGSGGDAVRAILCGEGLTKSLMTVGLNLGAGLALDGLPLADDQSNAGVKNTLNTLLGAAGVPKEAMRVSSVESIDAAQKDTVRFLKLEGNYAGAFGVAAGLMGKAAAKASSSNGAGLFSFVYESFNVSAATAHDEGGRALPMDWGDAFGPARASVLRPGLAAGTYNPQQWAYAQTEFSKAVDIFNKGKKDTDIVVAVVDTGVDSDHPDLKDIMVKGYNAIDGSSDTADGNGHGTHCAGIIAAQGKGGAGASLGVAAAALGSRVKIMPIKVLGDDGSGSSQAIEKGVRWAAANGADVISMSLGGGLEYSSVKKQGGLDNRIFKDAIAAGKIVVVAAGNENCALGGKCSVSGGLFSRSVNEYTVVPCAYEGTICVGATDPDETLAEYSNFSSKKSASYRTKADVNAPGTKIYATWPTKLANPPYKAISGTSMATPYVAGVAALLKAGDKSLTQDQVREILVRSQAYPSDVKERSETGRVDLYTAATIFAKDVVKDGAAAPVATPAPKPAPRDSVPPDQEGGGGAGLFTLWSAVCKAN